MLDPELGNRALEMQAEDEKLVQEFAPKARKEFTPKALNKLVDEWNRVAPVFGIKDQYPKFSAAATRLPVDFTKLLTMTASAVDDAITDGLELDPIKLSEISDDQGLVILASKLTSLSKNRDFKDWLASADERPMEEESEEETDSNQAMSDEEFTKLIATKIK